MDSRSDDYVAYLLRMWREDLDGKRCWRAALQNAQTREEQFFVDVEALVDYFRAEFSGTERSPPADPDGQRSVGDDT